MKIKFLTLITASIFITQSCNERYKEPNSSENKIEKMETENVNKIPNNENQISYLKESMLDYMETANPSYTKTDVEECEKILKNYVSEISNSQSKDEGMEIVKATVEKLNKLNERCNSELIETSEREQIAEIIISESSKKGYNQPEDDITEEWREW